MIGIKEEIYSILNQPQMYNFASILKTGLSRPVLKILKLIVLRKAVKQIQKMEPPRQTLVYLPQAGPKNDPAIKLIKSKRNFISL